MPRVALRLERLTQRRVDALQAARGRERDTVWDSVVRGLGVRVSATAKSFVVRFTPKGGKQRRETIGDADARHSGAFTLDAARDEARARLGAAAKGVITPTSMRVDKLIEHYLAHHKTRKKGRLAQDDRDTRRRCELVKSEIGGRPAHAVTHVEIARVLAPLSERAPYEANRTRALVRSLWNRARGWGFVPAAMINPAEGVSPNREQARAVRALRPAEVQRVITACRAHENAVAGRAIELLVLVGARKGEILGLAWEDVDLRERMITLRDRKGADTLTLPLSDAARDVLRRCPATGGSPWVFPSNRDPKKPLVDVRDAWEEIMKAAELPAKTRVHDLRAALATDLASRQGLRIAMLALGHADQRTTARYVRPASEDLRRAVNAYGSKVAKSSARPRKARAS